MVRYRIVKPSVIGVVPGGPATKYAEAECGELLLDYTSGHCVYRYWHDGIQSVPHSLRGKSSATVDKCRSVWIAAAGFDGSEYWMAEFPDVIDNKRRATAVVVIEDEQVLDRPAWQVGNSGLGIAGRWYNYAPLHDMLRLIECKDVRRAPLLAALHNYKDARKVAADSFTVNEEANADSEHYWQYKVTLDDSDVGVASVEARSLLAVGGHWPFAVDSVFHMRSDPLFRSDADDIELGFAYRTYCDANTHITKWSAVSE